MFFLGHISALYSPGWRVGNIHDNKGMNLAGLTYGSLVIFYCKQIAVQNHLGNTTSSYYILHTT